MTKSLKDLYGAFVAFDFDAVELEVSGLNADGVELIAFDEAGNELMKYGMQAEASRRSAVDLAVGKLIALSEAYADIECKCEACYHCDFSDALAQLRLALEGKRG